MRTGRSLPAVALGLLLAAACGGEEPAPPANAPPSPEEVTRCLEERGIAVEQRERPAWESASHLRIGEDPESGVAVGVLFYADAGAASRGASALRLAGEASIRVGLVIVVPAGPPFAEAENAVLECLGAQVQLPAP